MAVEPMAVEPMAVEPMAVEPMAVEPMAVEPMAAHEEVFMSFAIGSGSLSTVIAHWAASHAEAMSDELQTLMKQADERAQLLKELNELKGTIANACANPREFPAAQAALEAFLKDHPEYKSTFQALWVAIQGEVANFAGDPSKADDQPTKNTLAGYIGPNGPWGIALDAAIDDLRTQDRMGMIAIQDLVDKLKQAEMLGSNLIRSFHDAAETVIGNIS
jgi:hypothetical protein